jgi:hypothetical protein
MKKLLFGDGTAVTRGEFGQSLRHRNHKNTCDEKVTKPVIFRRLLPRWLGPREG